MCYGVRGCEGECTQTRNVLRRDDYISGVVWGEVSVRVGALECCEDAGSIAFRGESKPAYDYRDEYG